jgi:hypothetical protein
VVVVVALALTVTVPCIFSPWTVHQNSYLPGWENVHVPLHLVADTAGPTGTPLQVGVAGGLLHSTPCFTASLGLLKLTTPPAFTVAVGGSQRWYA